MHRAVANRRTSAHHLKIPKGGTMGLWLTLEGFERSRSKSSPLEITLSELANPVELTGFDRR